MSSLFSNLNNSQNRNSLFGTQGSSTQAGSSPFSGLNAPKPAQSTASLFGSNTQSSQHGGGIFGSAPSQQPGGGLFNNNTQPQQTSNNSLPGSTSQLQPSGAGLFRGAAQSQPAGGLFADSSQQARSTLNEKAGPPSNSLFGINAQQSVQEGQPSGAYFDSLLEKSRKRAHGETALEDLPNLQLGLGDIRQRIRKLGPSTQERASDSHAQFVLASSGVDVGSAVRDLSYFDAQTSRIERSEPVATPSSDVTSYLSTLQHQTTLSMIADGLARSVRDFEEYMEDNLAMEWDAQRKRIYQHFGIKPREGGKSTNGYSGTRSEVLEQGGFGRSRRSKAQSTRLPKTAGIPGGSIFDRSGIQRSVIGTPKPIGSKQQIPFVDVEKRVEMAGTNVVQVDDRLRREKQARFAEKVQYLNAARVDSKPYPLLHEFCDIEAQAGENYVEHVVKAYKAMIEIVEEDKQAQNSSEFAGVKERQFADVYLDEADNSVNTIQMNKRILAGASRHLEKQFFEDLEIFIAKNPRDANLGGIPNVVSKVRAFIRLRAARKDLVPDDTNLQMINDDYAWALVFYLLRSGHVREAVDYVTSNAVAFRAIDRNFATYITRYYQDSDRRLPRDLQDRINNEYNQRVRVAPENSIDPFRMACYNVIGRCDMAKKSLEGLVVDWPDWLWLQFTLAREVNPMDEIASEVYGLKEVQTTVDNVVSKHSQGTNSFGVFFYLQILSGRFEQAISFLYSYQYIDAVHFATALNYYGLLRVSSPLSAEGDLLGFNTRHLPQISFAKMIGYYTQDFRAANVTAAVDYLVLICLDAAGPNDPQRLRAAQCHEALRDLVLETREFAQLLGDVRESGERVKGAIEERIKLIGLDDNDDFMRTVTMQAASVADDNGRTTDAVLLYHLAGDYDNVIAICNRAMSDALATDISQDSSNLATMNTDDGRLASGEISSNGLSLTSFDNPVALTNKMLYLYQNFPEKIAPQNRNTCLVLQQINDARNLIIEGKWPPALDVSLMIYPLNIR